MVYLKNLLSSFGKSFLDNPIHSIKVRPTNILSVFNIRGGRGCFMSGSKLFSMHAVGAFF